MSTRTFLKIGLALVAVWAAPARAAEQADTQAVWTPKEASFTYMGFTTRYSCEGLVSKVKSVLLSLGARRSDLKVYGTGCLEPGRPAPAPGVKVRMNVLVPAGSSSDGAAAVTAHWKPVRVQLNADPLAESGECELVEQIKQKLLPLFSTRDVEFKPDCVPHQLSPRGTRLSAEVLVTEQPR
jgi:hypothetical protein